MALTLVFETERTRAWNDTHTTENITKRTRRAQSKAGSSKANNGWLALDAGPTVNGVVGPGALDAGPVTLDGNGTVLLRGDLNTTSGKPVIVGGTATLRFGISTFTGSSSIPPPGAVINTSSLTTTGGTIQVGDGSAPEPMVNVGGNISLDSTGTLRLAINAAGTTASSDYSQLNASGYVGLNGATLDIVGGSSSCPSLHIGDVDTLVSANINVHGTFAGIPDGTVVTMDCPSATGTPSPHLASTTPGTRSPRRSSHRRLPRILQPQRALRPGSR